MATLTAAQISTATPVSFFICSSIFFSFFAKSFLIFSAYSKSTLTPFHFISIKIGSRFVSKSKTLMSSCLTISFWKDCHNFNVNSASFSAYGPTIIAGSLCISPFGSTPCSSPFKYSSFSNFFSPR